MFLEAPTALNEELQGVQSWLRYSKASSGFKVPRLKSTESTSTGEKILKNHHFSPIFQERINDKISFKKDVESRIQSAQLRSSAIMDNLINAESHAKHEMRQPKEYEKI
jgi:hypothetical protein